VLNETLTIISAAGGGTVLGGGLVGWLFKSYIGKVDKLIETVVELKTTIKLNETLKSEVKDHEKRLNLLEPKVDRAWEKIDRGLSSIH